MAMAVFLAALALSARSDDSGFKALKQYAPSYADGVAWLDLSGKWADSAFSAALRRELGVPVRPCKVMVCFKSGDDISMAMAAVMTSDAVDIDGLAELFNRAPGSLPVETTTYREGKALLVNDNVLVVSLADKVFAVGEKESLDRYFSSGRGMSETLAKQAEPYLELPCFGTMKMADDDHNYMLRSDFSAGIDGDYLAIQCKFTMFDDLAAKRYCEELRMIWPSKARDAAGGDRDLRRSLADAAVFSWKNDVIRVRAVFTADMFSAMLRKQMKDYYDEDEGKVR